MQVCQKERDCAIWLQGNTTSVPPKTLHGQGKKFQLDMIRRPQSALSSHLRLSSARVLLLHRCELPRYVPMHAACSRNRIVSSACHIPMHSAGSAAEPPSPSALSALNEGTYLDYGWNRIIMIYKVKRVLPTWNCNLVLTNCSRLSPLPIRVRLTAYYLE